MSILTGNPYTSGKIVLLKGQKAFSGLGTGWLTAGLDAGCVLNLEGYVVAVDQLTGEGTGVLAEPWPGADHVAPGVAYRMWFNAPAQQLAAKTIALVNLLGNGNLAAIAGITPANGTVMQYLTLTGWQGSAITDLLSGAGVVLTTGAQTLQGKTFSGATYFPNGVWTAGGPVGINTTNPVSTTTLHLHIAGAQVSSAAGILGVGDDFIMTREANATGFVGIIASNNYTHRMVFKGTRSRGTLDAPTAVQSGDWVFSLLGVGYDGAAVRATAAITMVVDGPAALGVVPQRIAFETGTTSSRIERLRVNSTGEIGVGKTATAGVLLDVSGPIGAKSYTVATLPSAAIQAGQIIYVSDESGGAVLAFSDGTNWRRVTDRAVVS